MPVITRCPQCGQKLQVPSKRVGDDVSCPKCSSSFLLPVRAEIANPPPEVQNETVTVGTDINPYVPPQDVSGETARSQLFTNSSGERYKGVGGWLLLFCLGLTVFTPLISFGSLATSWSSTSRLFADFPGLLVVMIIDTLLSAAVIVFSVYAGVGLWGVWPNAVRTAKRYLLCFLAYHVVSSILPFMAGLPSEANEAMIQEVAKETTRAVVYFGIWYLYLCRSKRVKATYGE